MTANGDFDLMSTTRVNGIDSHDSEMFPLTESAEGSLSQQSRQMNRAVPIHFWYTPLKAVCEYVLAITLFALSIPFVVVAAVLIKGTSKGPIFYRQDRVGKHGRIFRVIKLRTMVNNAESQTGPVWSTQNDHRITPIGKFLRETHIDEFPQLINVLLGQMALVGPRPERPEIVQELEWKIPNYSERTNVRPGITGLSQLKLPPDTDLESVRRKQIFDLYYVTHVSAWLDVRILASTAWLLLRAIWRGAFSLIALPPSSKVLSSVETIVGSDSELLVTHRQVPPK